MRRYFAEIAATAEFRTGWALGRTALLAFPTAAPSSALAWAEAALEDAGSGRPDPSLAGRWNRRAAACAERSKGMIFLKT